jgi:DNA (cytosine-5)-methyltransferase 1
MTGLRVYYNDNEPFVAQWLRNLITAGHLPAGDVDERPIQEVQPDDLQAYTQCHFFAGIGGWPYALQLAGWGDRPVWTGSCPCQPFSAAGKRGSHADKRHLWPAWFRLIGERHPVTIFGEQVSSAIDFGWWDAVSSDLGAAGYTSGSVVLGAAGLSAPHVRNRLWFVAALPDAHSDGWEGERQETPRAWSEQQFEGLVQDQLQHALPTGRLRALADGVSGRMGKLRAYGNAIVPQVAAAFVSAYMECLP